MTKSREQMVEPQSITFDASCRYLNLWGEEDDSFSCSDLDGVYEI